jgi:hypothetical protein
MATQSAVKAFQPNLRPDSFKAKALAAGAVEVDEGSRRSDTVTLNDGETEVQPLDLCRIKPEYETRRIVTDRHIIVGGLAHDDAPVNFLEEFDAEGHLYFSGRSGRGQVNQDAFAEALGLLSDNDKNLELPEVEQLAAEAYRVLAEQGFPAETRASLAMLAKEGHNGFQAWEMLVDDFRNRWEGAYEYPLSAHMDKAEHTWDEFAEKAWETGRAEGEVGNRDAVMFCYSYDNLVPTDDESDAVAVWVPCKLALENIEASTARRLSEAGVRWVGSEPEQEGFAQFSLDGGLSWQGEFASREEALQALRLVQRAGGMPFDPDVPDDVRHQVVEEYAKGVVETYNQWANGEVYGVLVYVIDRETGERLEEHDHEVWGFFGMEYAEEEMEGEMLSMLEHLSQDGALPQAA